MPDALQTELTRKPTPEPVEDTARWPEWAEEARLDDELTARPMRPRRLPAGPP